MMKTDTSNFSVHHQSSKRALIIFTSDPAREALRKNLGENPHRARKIYQSFLKHILDIAFSARRKTGFDIIIASDSSDIPSIERAFAGYPEALTHRFIKHAGEKFGDKFSHTLRTASKLGYERLVIIGNDCPDITPEMIASAFNVLDQKDVVLGPANDGGFYLLGIREYTGALFRKIDWCTSSVFRQICRNIDNLEKSHIVLPCLHDIDTKDDLKNWLLAPPQYYSQIVHIVLNGLFITDLTTAVYNTPFLSKTHLKKRIWQLPPPAA